MKKLIIISIAVLLICVGLSGCNEIINDDDKFLIKAKAIVSGMYPISRDNINIKGYKATTYRLEIADYTLSSGCEEIRDDLDFCLGQIDYLYQSNQYTYTLAFSPEMLNMINTILKSLSSRIREMT